MKICLLSCPAPFLINEKVFPPLGLLAVGTALRLQGHEVSVQDTLSDCSYFAIGPTTPEYTGALELLRQIKERDNSSQVVIGGPHAIANAEECITDGFDVVALGDGENITIDTFESKGIIDLGRKPLSEYPILDRSLVDIKSYQYEIEGRKATTIVTARGCPYHCGFCSKTESRVRYRTTNSIEEEISYLQDNWGYNALMFFDDTFIVNRERLQRICNVLKKRGILWRCFVRGDLIVKYGPGLVDLMRDCGCVEVGIGIESGSDKILQIINKGETFSILNNAISILRAGGIRIKGFFIVGLPGEDQHTLGATWAFLAQTQLDDVDFAIYQPFKGSPIYDNLHSYDIQIEDIPTSQRFYKGRKGEYRCRVSTSLLSQAQIIRARDKLESWFRCQ